MLLRGNEEEDDHCPGALKPSLREVVDTSREEGVQGLRQGIHEGLSCTS